MTLSPRISKILFWILPTGTIDFEVVMIKVVAFCDYLFCFMICMFSAITKKLSCAAFWRRLERLVICFRYNAPVDISKNRSKNLVSLDRTLSRFLVRSPVGEKRETGGKTLVMAVPVIATLPSRKALFIKV